MDEMAPEAQQHALDMIHRRNLALTQALPLRKRSLHLYLPVTINNVPASLPSLSSDARELRRGHRAAVDGHHQQSRRGGLAASRDQRVHPAHAAGRGRVDHRRRAERVRRVHRGTVLRDQRDG